MTTNLTTSDTDFAAALIARGAKLVDHFPSSDKTHRRMLWKLGGIDPKWIEDYRTGADGFHALVHARRMLLTTVKTDERMKQ